MSLPDKLILLFQLLSDGRYHSGETLGQRLGVSRAAVWKQLQRLEEFGISIESKPGLGYRVAGGIELLDREQIKNYLSKNDISAIGLLETHLVLDSTNKYLMDKISEARGARVNAACFAEMQTSGKGRRGRVWQSPFAKNIYLSVSQQFSGGVKSFEGLSLAVGLGIVEGLEALGYSGIQLKWPNDILWQGRKLAGILVEVAGDLNGECHAVVGLGLNVLMNIADGEKIDQPWVALNQIPEVASSSRNEIAAILLSRIIQVMFGLPEKGFAYYREAWLQRAAYLGEKVLIVNAQTQIEGRLLGVNSEGGVLLDVDGDTEEFVGGELSLRVAGQ